jgi:hypothetical protein
VKRRNRLVRESLQTVRAHPRPRLLFSLQLATTCRWMCGASLILSTGKGAAAATQQQPVVEDYRRHMCATVQPRHARDQRSNVHGERPRGTSTGNVHGERPRGLTSKNCSDTSLAATSPGPVRHRDRGSRYHAVHPASMLCRRHNAEEVLIVTSNKRFIARFKLGNCAVRSITGACGRSRTAPRLDQQEPAS